MKTHILLIDDDEDEWEILDAALRRLPVKYDCMWVRSAEHALQLLNNYIPDYIFIDFNMPKINGLQCLEEIRKIKTLNDIPVILYSNFIDARSSEMAKSLGATACIQKPTVMQSLVNKLNEILVCK